MAEKKSDKGPDFEKALARLEAIVAEMEGGKLSLEKTVAHFEEGTGLVKYCTEKLNEVERKIEILAKKGDQLVAEPFEGGGDDPEGRAPSRLS
jgi:exodeoxyribonuclease VII small subunit